MKNADKILKSFTTSHTFNETDQVLQNVKYWPSIASVSYFQTKLKFQIQHSLFRYLPIIEQIMHAIICILFAELKFKRVTKTWKRFWIGMKKLILKLSDMSLTASMTLTFPISTGFITEYYPVSQNKLCHVKCSKPNKAQFILGLPVEHYSSGIKDFLLYFLAIYTFIFSSI